jgi:nucleotide-binding universal stress UspA family protein
VILISYDGSADAQAAIERAGELLAGQQATVLTVWEPIVELAARSGAGFAIGGMATNVEQFDSASEKAARERADEGVERARRAGLEAQPRTCAADVTVPETIVSQAEQLDASAIVVGTRGLTGIKSFVLGSVSHDVLVHADRPVMVVPSPEVAAERAKHRR